MGLQRCSGTSLLCSIIILGSTETLYQYSWYRILVTTSTSNTRVNRNLGHHEAKGLLGAIRYLGSQVPEIDRTRWGEVELLRQNFVNILVDRTRIGLHGWSYGAFLTLAAMTSQKVFFLKDCHTFCFWLCNVHENTRIIKVYIGLVGRSTMDWDQWQRF